MRSQPLELVGPILVERKLRRSRKACEFRQRDVTTRYGPD